jgi:hypothetical protein
MDSNLVLEQHCISLFRLLFRLFTTKSQHKRPLLLPSFRGLGGDVKAEKQLVVLLSMPLSTRDAVTVLSLDQYPPLMGLLSRRTHKDMALKVVQTVLTQVGMGGDQASVSTL